MILNRSVDHDRTQYRPTLEWCSCKPCRQRAEEIRKNAWAGDEDAIAELKRPAPANCCEWVNWEKIFAESWEHECEARPGINQGHGTIQNLMFHMTKRGDLDAGKLSEGQASILRDPWLGARERTVAATAIQWLGTNCGFGFLTSTLRKIGKELEDTEHNDLIRRERGQLLEENHRLTSRAKAMKRLLAYRWKKIQGLTAEVKRLRKIEQQYLRYRALSPVSLERFEGS